MSTEIIASLISSVVGGLLVALVNHLFTKRKTEAEAQKLVAEADKIRAEAEKTRVETARLLPQLQKLSTSVEEANYYRTSQVKEKTLYDSTQGIDVFDFEWEGTYVSEKLEGEVGQGSITVKQGSLIIERKNAMGGFAVYLRRYSYTGKVYEFIPRNEFLSGKRKLRISCDAKITKGTCQLRFAFSEHPTKMALEVKSFDITKEDWIPINLYFKISPTVDSYLAIYEVNLSDESNLLLRNIVLAEHSST